MVLISQRLGSLDWFRHLAGARPNDFSRHFFRIFLCICCIIGFYCKEFH
ncbi:MAG: hypothetical protein RLZZ522_1871, partial [Verrucomicrobiota bacterium]